MEIKDSIAYNQVMNRKYDILTIGRSSIDLYSNDLGAPFEKIQSFGAFVGGSSTNIAVGCNRLGLKTALLTAVGKDKVGDFILHFLEEEGIETQFIPAIEYARTSAVILGIEPPERFPLVFYRDNCADIELTIDHVINTNLADFKGVVLSGTALSKDPSRTATFFAAEEALANDVRIFLDLDFRADQWFDPRAYGITIRSLLPKVDFAIGTEEEILAASLQNNNQITIKDQQISAPVISGAIDEAIQKILDLGVKTLVVKRGSDGASIFEQGKEEIKVLGFPVEVLNVLGAGDAFASGFVYGCLNNWDLYKSIRLGNACGAILVTQHGCSNFSPTLEKALAFAEAKGGLDNRPTI
ncbi:MAG: 5-dehydro-2-deoxygluconokinase [Bacteroidota bacterium]